MLSKEEIYEGYKQLFGEIKAMQEAVYFIINAEKNHRILCDLDGNDTIDYNEFLSATLNRNKVLSKNNLEAAFSYFEKV